MNSNFLCKDKDLARRGNLLYLILRDDSSYALDCARDALKSADPIKGLYESGLVRRIREKYSLPIDGADLILAMHSHNEISDEEYQKLLERHTFFRDNDTKTYFRLKSGQDFPNENMFNGGEKKKLLTFIEKKGLFEKQMDANIERIYEAVAQYPTLLEEAKKAVTSEDPIKALYHSGLLKRMRKETQVGVDGNLLILALYQHGDIDDRRYKLLQEMDFLFMTRKTKEYALHLLGTNEGIENIVRSEGEKPN